MSVQLPATTRTHWCLPLGALTHRPSKFELLVGRKFYEENQVSSLKAPKKTQENAENEKTFKRLTNTLENLIEGGIFKLSMNTSFCRLWHGLWGCHAAEAGFADSSPMESWERAGFGVKRLLKIRRMAHFFGCKRLSAFSSVFCGGFGMFRVSGCSISS